MFVPAHRHHEVHTRLLEDGVAWLEDARDPDTLLALASALGTPVLGEDTDARGIKTVDVAHRGSALHTDRSNMEAPPVFTLIACLKQGDSGGETVLVDGRRLWQGLSTSAREALSVPGSACFGRPGWERRGAIFEDDTLRYRRDPHGLYTTDVWAHMPEFERLTRELTVRVRLRTGQAYVLDNRRWLHGALPAQGTRRVLRVLIDPAPHGAPFGLRRSEP